jgi:hypothetical protein
LTGHQLAVHGDERTPVRVFEDVVGGGEFFQSETGRLAGVAEPVVRSENH